MLRRITIFNSARKHSWHHEICSRCKDYIDAARFNKKEKLFPTQG